MNTTQEETKLDEFTKAYIECALWSSTNDDGEPLDNDYDASDISPEGFKSAIRDCEAFQANITLLGEYYGKFNAEMAGHDFWLTRNGHGAGFWDRGLG